jgi:hypothetical protein
MSNEISKSETFEQKLMNRIREGIGDLMSDEDLAKIIKKGTDDVFFKGKVVSSGYGTKTEEPEIYQIISNSLQPRITECIEKYISENNEEVKEVIDKYLAGKTAGLFSNSINVLFREAFDTFEFKIRDVVMTLKNEGYL